MVFSSLLFVFVFLVVFFAVYARSTKRSRNTVLLAASLVFYGWGGPAFIVLLMAVTLVSWLCALRMAASEDASSRKRWLVAGVAALLAVLAFFKYANWVAGGIFGLFGQADPLPKVALPLGISFFTFELVSYLADVYTGKAQAQPSYARLLLYSSMFFQCTAGPIVRYNTVAEGFDDRHVTKDDLFFGLHRFCVGLAKKAVLAGGCSNAVDKLLPVGTDALSTQAGAGLWLGMLFYMLYIYLDFSAYSDMAIGLARMAGFHFFENFNYPYLCSSVRDFWRRWHISLSSFFRDYVYIPLGGSRCSTLKIVRNYAVVWFLTGLWHGASWNYIFWGLYYFVFLMLERFVVRDRLPRWLGHICSLVVVYFGWVLFKFENPSELAGVLAGMFGLSGNGWGSLEVQTVFLQNAFLLVFCIVACTNLGKRARTGLYHAAQGSDAVLRLFNAVEVAVPVVLLLVSVVSLVGANYNPFLYAKF